MLFAFALFVIDTDITLKDFDLVFHGRVKF